MWVHGDFKYENILVQKGRLTSVIDFGCMGIGDPACDLTIAWTFLDAENRKVFRKSLGLDTDTWARARGWALWKAIVVLAVSKQSKDRPDIDPIEQQRVIQEVLEDHALEFGHET
ncbi:MAG: phosphotransferase [bacterium]|nr:phosphotransferase [bacterium]